MARPNRKLEAKRARSREAVKRWRNPQDDPSLTDFAEMLQHIVSATVTADKGDASSVAANLLRGLMAAQNDRDAVLREPFVLPPERNSHKSWRKWQKSLPPDAFNRTPVLVRVDPEKPWGPGNMIFITELWEPLYRQAGSLDAFNGLLKRLAASPGVLLPSAMDVMDAASKIKMASNPPPGVIPNDA